MKSCKASKKQQQETRYQLQLKDQINELQCQLSKAMSDKQTQELLLKKLCENVEQLSANNVEEIQKQMLEQISDLQTKISQQDETYTTINNTVEQLNSDLQNIVHLIKQQQEIDSQLMETFQKRIQITQQIKPQQKAQNKQKDQQFNQYMRILAERINDKDKELNGLLDEVQEPKKSCDYRKHLQKYEEQFQMEKHHNAVNDEGGKVDLVQLVQTELGRISSPHNSDQLSNDGLRLSPVSSNNSNSPVQDTKPNLDNFLGKIAQGLEIMQNRK